MQVTIKTLQQSTFTLDVEPADSVLSLKERIAKDHGHAVALQKLIYSGKILDDAKTIGEYGLKDKEFLVLMVTKPKAEKPAPAVAASSSSSAASAAAKTAEKPKPAVSVTPAAVAPAAVTPAAVTPSAAPAVTAGAATTAATTSTGASALVSGSEYEATVQNLMEMGFDREQIVRAMRAAFNNPDRAVEYLMSGIPESVTNEMSASAAAAPSPGAAGAGGATGASPLAALRGQPQFEQLRQLIQQQPQLLEPILQQLAASNPQLLQIIQQNPQALMELLGGAGGEQEGMFEGDEGEGDEEGDEEGDDLPAGAQVIELTEEERQAVERLAGLGFDPSLALEAYLACDKNEQLAANYLFDSGNFQ